METIKRRIASGRVFVEKDFYIEPPNISEDASEEEIVKIWDKWYELDSQEKAKHKREIWITKHYLITLC